jgi:hypothetical protein
MLSEVAPPKAEERVFLCLEKRGEFAQSGKNWNDYSSFFINI